MLSGTDPGIHTITEFDKHNVGLPKTDSMNLTIGRSIFWSNYPRFVTEFPDIPCVAVMCGTHVW